MSKTKASSQNPPSRRPAKVKAITEQNKSVMEEECRATSQTPEQLMDACEEAIRERAYLKWMDAGCPPGDGFDFWIEAEREVMPRKPVSKSAWA